jgi:hypothetical protein
MPNIKFGKLSIASDAGQAIQDMCGLGDGVPAVSMHVSIVGEDVLAIMEDDIYPADELERRIRVALDAPHETGSDGVLRKV